MRALILAVPAVLALAACAEDGSLSIPTPTSMLAGDRITQFCAADFIDQPTAALAEWIAVYNAFAPLVKREPIPAGAITEHEAVVKLLAAREAVCFVSAS